MSIAHCHQAGNHDAATALGRGTAALATARDRLIPVALDAKERIVPLALDAKERLVPIALDAKERIAPLAAEATERIAPLVQEVAAKARPAVATAVTRVTEVVDTEVKPRLAELLDDAQRDARVAEAAKRSRAAVATLTGDVAPVALAPVVPAAVALAAVAPTPAKKKGHPVLKVLGLAALVAIAIAVLRTVLGPRDEDWESDEGEDWDDDVESEPTEPIIPSHTVDATVEDEPPAPAGPDDIPVDDAPTADLGNPFRYGEGSFIGTNPPEGYTIKGNEKSMKYHVPGALAYERCSTQIWFNSSEAAERAGFVRAER